ncbi:hypothetical protein CABS01_04865, partial [Colletotrichum abscissum]|uniref:uncharacterized protein n=1 Tax=Colletotrichum abscissum TaxID=1671311 RepID=UPI0027D58CB8
QASGQNKSGKKQRRSRWRTIPDKATALVICLTRVNGGQPDRRYLQDSRTASGVTISAQLHQVGLKFATQVAACLEHRQLQSSQEPPPRLLDTQERDGRYYLMFMGWVPRDWPARLVGLTAASSSTHRPPQSLFLPVLRQPFSAFASLGN